MKIIGTYEEICAMNCFLLGASYHCGYQQPYRDLDNNHYAGKWKGFDIDFEIIKKPIRIGLIGLGVDNIFLLIAKKHGGLNIGMTPPDGITRWCFNDGTQAVCFGACDKLRGQKFDELWMDSLPSNWDEFDLCITSVNGDRSKIHFFKELNNETT